LKAGLKDIIESEEREFFQEIRGMSGDKARKMMDNFKNCSRSDRKGVLCATTTGRFAEGTDFPGKELEGIFLVGIPFDQMSVKTKIYLNYYEKLYGKRKGIYYAYIVPALRRASQSLGRALRSKEDKAIFILGDERYKEERFFRLLPDFVQETAQIIDFEKISEKVKSWIDSSR
jgi:DNA excision repair protein ERCC-2